MTRSLQLNLAVFFATNSLRRNVAQHTVNYLSTSSEQRLITKSLNSGQTVEVTNDSPTVGCVLRTNAPVTVLLTPRDGSSTLVLTVRKLMFLDQDFSKIEVVATTNSTNLEFQIA